MKPGAFVLIIGGVVLAAGLVIAGISAFTVTQQVLEGSTIIENTTLEPNLSVSAVMKDLPAGQELIVSLSGNPSDVPLYAEIDQPDGSVLATYNVNETPFTSTATTEMTGDHTVVIKNVGTSTVNVNGAILNSPIAQQAGGVSVQDSSSMQTLIAYGVGILVGISLVIAGIVLLIIGAIKLARGKKSAPPTSPAQ